jgi:anaerobic selenocysteine-containing dehydrogenase
MAGDIRDDRAGHRDFFPRLQTAAAARGKESNMIDESNNAALSRRQFLGNGAFLGGLFAGLTGCSPTDAATEGRILKSKRPDVPYDLNDPENTLYSVCMNCNTGCGIKAKIQNGVLTKIDGSPYNPWALFPHLPMSTSLDDAARVDGGLCPKGQAGAQTLYDPYRLRKVIKRAGKRGENKWITIDFEKAVAEIVEGGNLFIHVPGEEHRHVEGLRSIMALKDDSVAKAMASGVQAIWDEKDAAKKQALIADFKAKHAVHLDELIDPDHPDLGPKNNQFVMAWGRLKGGRSDFMKRFGAGFGTTNLHGHTTVCQGSLYFTCKAISEQYVAGKFTGGEKFYWQADTENARYILFVGANLFEANYGPTNRTVRLTEHLTTGYTKIAVIDPRFSKLASKAHKWLPIKPGEDAALAMAMIRWMIEHERFDAKFLRGANKAAAAANGETSWTNATWLVEVKNGKPGKFIRAADLGFITPEKRSFPDPKDKTKSIAYEERFFLVLRGGQPAACDPNDDKTPVEADLFVDTEVAPANGAAPVRVKSSLQLLKKSAEEHSFAEWCEIAGLDPAAVDQVARELTSYGKQAAVDIHRGVAQHTNGFYNVLAWMTVNMLLGNFDWKGGMVKATTYGYDGSRGGPFDLGKVPGKISAFGISSIRHDVAYEKTTLFEGYPAKRNWYPLASDVYEEIVPSIGEAYPYPVKALFLYMGTPIYALPAGHTNIEVLADVHRLPLFFTSDITIGTTSMYADYIFPDLTFLERWEFQGSHPNMPNKVAPVRQPVAAPIPESVMIYGEDVPISFESLLMALAEKLGLKAFGKDALGSGRHLNRPEDYYLRAVANIALGEKPGAEVPDADARELELFAKARRHLPGSVFDEVKWRTAAGEENWRKVVYVLNRGGRFEEHAKGFSGEHLAHTYGKLLNIYQEKTATTIHSGTGKSHRTVARYIPQLDFAGQPLDKQRQGHDLHLITHRTSSQTKSRTIGCYWLQPIMPENGILMNSADVRRLGFKNGDVVRVVSATNQRGEWDLKNGMRKPIEGKIVQTETIRPGVISFALGFGHWATGAADIIIDERIVKGDPRRATGIHANAAMWTDPALRHNTCLLDPVGGSVSFYDTQVRLERVA